jgi:hypothetical protein
MTTPLSVSARTRVTCDDGNTWAFDTIAREGGLWLVPKWLASPYPGMKMPARIIRVDLLALQDLGQNILASGPHVYKLVDPIPKAVLDGAMSSPPDTRLVIVEGPNPHIRMVDIPQ